MIRYGLMSRPILAEAERVTHIHGTKAWADLQQKRMTDSIDRQAEKQIEEEKEANYFNTATLDEDEVMSYFINKRKAK
jgi:hypothetical protein